jgi:hypothetical protein
MAGKSKLIITPITQAEAKIFIREHHRHHLPSVGSIFNIGCAREGIIVGVAMVGRPVARGLDDGWTVEVTRLCTDGTKNACSKLYAAARKIASAMGYKKIVTYILESEQGTSLKAAGWKMEAKTFGGSWDCRSRPRVDKAPTQRKFRWEIEL